MRKQLDEARDHVLCHRKIAALHVGRRPVEPAAHDELTLVGLAQIDPDAE